VKSLSSQLAYTYSANRVASYPFTLLFTSLGGRLLERLESLNDAGYKRWSETEWWTEGYECLWAPETATANDSQAERGTPDRSIVCAKETVVYLTADAEGTLSELKPEETYIIGGIVDHNRHKVDDARSSLAEYLTPPFQNLCQRKAKEAGIRTARLPIGEYLANLPTRKVLTVNQVFEILVKWAETRDWELALNHVMPKRKFNAEGRLGKTKSGEELAGEQIETVSTPNVEHDKETESIDEKIDN
jgi:tRNA (guanine9-N1)-methyltransferase